MDEKTKAKIDKKLKELQAILIKSKADSMEADIYALDRVLKETVDYLIWKRFGLYDLSNKLEDYSSKHF